MRRAVLLLIAVCLAAPAFGSTVRPLNVEQMADRADRVLHARCVRVRAGVDPSLGQVVTRVTLAPLGRAKGDVRGPLTIRLLGDRSEGAHPGEAVEGVPLFTEGEEVVLFLYPDSAAGLTSPVGFGQGKFSVVRDKAGRSVAVNGFGNRGMLDRLTPAGQRRLGARAEAWRGHGGISPQALMELVRSLEGER